MPVTTNLVERAFCCCLGARRVKQTLDIGLVYSRTGSYLRLSDGARAGVLQAVAEVNADPAGDWLIRVHEADPAGQQDHYAPAMLAVHRETGCRHFFGAMTSSSRKEMIPALERCGASLWYGAPYEGFEAADCVAYMHTTVNQNVIPLLDWTLPRLGRRVFLVGSNYIWGWEINRIARDLIAASGCEVVAERHIPLGDTDIAALLDEIARTRPDIVLNSLVGETQYCVLRALRAAGIACRVLSCNFTEAELPEVGEAAEGLISIGPYFAQPGDVFDNSLARAGYLSVMNLVRLLSLPGANAAMTLPELLALGPGDIDPVSHHVAQPIVIAEVRGGAFAPLLSLPVTAGDPYLARTPRIKAERPRLRIVK